MAPTAPIAPALTCTGVTKRFRRGALALDGIDLTIEPGEHVGLLAPNGSGKSTLVKIVCGLVRPTSGRVEVFGAAPREPAARAQLGYLAELFRFPEWLSAHEVLALHQRFARSNGGAAERERLLDRVGLGAADLRTRRVAAFSKGMQQRLGIAQALIGDPALVLLDEPTSALDPAGRRDVRDLLHELRERGVTVLLNSHLLGEVEQSCDRVVIMREGRVVREGTPSALVRSEGVEVELDSGPRRYPSATRDDVPGIVRELVAAGEAVFGVTVRRSTLEEVYLEAIDHTGSEAQ